MAKVFVDPTAHRPERGGGADFATRWYRSCTSEPASPTLNLNVQSVFSLNPVCLDALLDGIIANCTAGDDIVIVGHGQEFGLSMSLLPGSATHAQALAVSALGTMTETVDGGFRIPPVSVSEAASLCQITDSQVSAFRSKITRVRALRLRHVAIRGCKIGRWPDVLRMYKPFFGCGAVSAPTHRDVYGVCPSSIEGDLDAWTRHWLRLHRHNSHSHSYPAQQVVVGTAGGGSDEHRIRVALAAASETACSTWQSQYIGRASTGEFSFHGQWLTLIVAGQARIIFTGDSNYVSQLVVV